ncbi:MAG: CHRD domain-containing protein [Ktedonobacteraceae bacterium]
MTVNETQQFEKSIPYGYAFLVWSPQTKNLVVTLNLTGLIPDSVHPSHIRQGSCASMGPIVYSLNNVVADKHGNAFTTTVIPNVASIAASGWYINVHHGPGLSTPAQMASIYCGNITNTSPTTNHIQIIKAQLNSI